MRRPAVAHCREVGKALAELHVAGMDFPLSRGMPCRIEGWRKLWHGFARRAPTRSSRALPPRSTRISQRFDRDWPKDLPAGIIHADLFPDNVFFLGDKLSGLIDFYFACNDLYAYDVATCLNAWCFEKDFSFNLTKGTALLAGYQSVRPLSEAEKQALPILARGSALRFMLTRLYDWLTIPDGALVQKRDPVEYIRRLRFHRAINRPPNTAWHEDTSRFSPTAPARAIRARAAGARSCASTATRRNCPAARPTPPTTAWSSWRRSRR